MNELPNLSPDKTVTVNIDYPGSVISVNHFKFYGGRFTKPEVKDFMNQLGWMIKTHHLEDWPLPISITCNGTFRDMRSCPDLSNLAKVVCDAVQEVTGINDRNYRWHDGTIRIDKSLKPELELIFKAGD